MLTIHKFPLQVTDRQTLAMPQGAKILKVDIQHGRPWIWALVNPSARLEVRDIVVIGTGHDIEFDPGKYLDSIQLSGGALVFHVFDQGPVYSGKEQ